MSYHFEAYKSYGSYDLAYDHLNHHTDLGFKVKVVHGRFHSSDDEHGVQVAYVTTSRPVTRREMSDMAHSALAYGCRCEHDCCGHWQRSPSTYNARSNKRGTKWAIVIRAYRNL